MEDKLTNLLIAIILIIVIGLAGIYAYKYFETTTQIAIEPNYHQVNYITEGDKINAQITTKNNVSKNQNQAPSTSIVIPVTEENTSSEKTQPEATQSEAYKYNNRYYYNQLNKCEKAIYDSIIKNFDKLKMGKGTINLDYDFNELLNEKDGNIKLKQYYNDAINAINMDIPSLFYINLSKLSLNIESTTTILGTKYNLYIDTGEYTSYYLDGFDSNSQVEEAIARVEAILKHQISTFKGEDYIKTKLAHDWLIDYVIYNSESNNRCTVYGAFMEKKCVCEGYARAYKYLLDNMGIENILVIGNATNSNGVTEEHMWNYVKLNNNWYAVDCTWDDPIVYGGGTIGYDIKHRYFLVGSNDIANSHFVKNVISPEGMTYTIPTLSANKY